MTTRRSFLVASAGAALASAAWFPLALLILWAVAIGIWLLAARPAPAAAPAVG